MKKKIGMALFCASILLAGCTKDESEKISAPIISQKYDYINNSVPIIDAIIDSESEFKYIQTVQDEYGRMKSGYDTATTQISVLMSQLKGQSMEQEKSYLRSLKGDIEHFKTRIETIDLPRQYRSVMLQALQQFDASLTQELTRVAENESGEVKEETMQQSNTYYEKAQEYHLQVQDSYNKIMSGK